MNTKIVNEMPRPVAPTLETVNQLHSVFNVFGFSLWKNEVLEKEMAEAQRRHAEKRARFNEKVKVWDELTSYTHTVYMDTNILLDETHRNYVINLCKENNWPVVINKFVYSELEKQSTYSDEKETDQKKKKRKLEIKAMAIKALDAIEVDGVSVFKPEKGEEVYKSVRIKYKDKFGSELMDIAIAELLTEEVKLGNKVFLISNDGDFGSYTRFEAEKAGTPEAYQHFNMHGLEVFAKEIKTKQQLLK